MLPERISNDLCSLRETVDRPALAVRMTFAAGRQDPALGKLTLGRAKVADAIFTDDTEQTENDMVQGTKEVKPGRLLYLSRRLRRSVRVSRLRIPCA